MRNVKLLILDCDGVLVRSEKANMAYYNHLFHRFGLDQVTEAETEKRRLLHTFSTPQVIRHFFAPHIQDEVTRFADSLEYLAFADLMEKEPGWDATLARLKSRLSICVATNRGRSAPQVLEAIGLSGHIERVFTVNHVKNPKPAPDLLVLALESFGVPAVEALYVGDSDLDRRAARSAGVPFAGFRTEGEFSIQSPYELEELC